jgi:uncharacterized protein (DUF362 family)
MLSLVSIVKAGSYPNSIQLSIEKSLQLIKFSFDPDIKKVAIKPNLCYYLDSSTGETTDPKFVSALVDVIRKKLGAEVAISIVESDASAMRCEHAFRILGYDRMAEEQNVSLVNLTNDATKSVDVLVQKSSFQFQVPNTIAEADLFISVPKIKYMPRVKFSCALKNSYGCNPFQKKYKYHPCLDQAIVGLNKVMKPDLAIIDGMVARGVYALKLNLIMASTDIVALDCVAATIAGLNPRAIKHIKLACSEGIGRTQYVCAGESLHAFRDAFPKKTNKMKLWELISRVYSRMTPKIQ